MPLFADLNRVAAGRGLKFIVIGGHAVMLHGYVRATDDTDILVDKDKRNSWIDAVGDLGYVLDHDGGTFLQFSAGHSSGWDLDLMLVPAETFEKFLAEAKPSALEGAAILIPKLEHLLALKLHAAKHGPALRKLKDLDDIIRLAVANHLQVQDDAFRQLCEKHGSKELYEQIIRVCTE
jgi:predicted nucleotidyltransferase